MFAPMIFAAQLPRAIAFQSAVKPKVPKTPTKQPATKAALAPGSGGGTPVLVTKVWTPKIPLTGWSVVDDTSWPESGKALVVESRKTSLEVRKAPSIGSPGLLFQKGRSSTGPVTFLAIRDYGEWVQVALPVRPNMTVGWVRGAHVSRIAVTHRIVIELSSNRMWIEDNGKEVANYPVASGTGGTPTPTGLFYIRELVTQANTSGPYGPYIFGLSGHSDVLNSFAGGEGAIGIHGTNKPDSIGDASSHGCIRVANDVIIALTRTLPLGTPVEIVGDRSMLPTQRRSMAEPDAIVAVEAPPGSATGGVVIDFQLEPGAITDRTLDSVDAVDVTPAGA